MSPLLRRSLPLAVLLLGLTGVARAADVCTGKPLGIGPGMSLPCGKYVAMKGQQRAVADAWLYGVISGANLYAPKFNQVGGTKTNAETLEDIGHVCRIMPDKPIADAVALYLRELTKDCSGNPPAAPAAASPQSERRA